MNKVGFTELLLVNKFLKFFHNNIRREENHHKKINKQSEKQMFKNAVFIECKFVFKKQ